MLARDWDGAMARLAGSRCVVVGGAGSIGSYVAEALLDNGASVVVIDTFATGREALGELLVKRGAELLRGDVTDREVLRSAFAAADFVFHLAAAWMGACQVDPGLGFATNVTGTFNVLEAAASAGVRKVVLSSAAAVYGEPRHVPITEDHSLDAVTHYGVGKVVGERLAAAYSHSSGMSYVALRYFNVYGPRHDHRGNQTQIIPRWLTALEAGQAPVIHGDGTQTMDFVYIVDVARANLLAAASNCVGVYNVASGTETSANDLADLLIELTGAHVVPVYQGEDNAAVRRRLGSTEKASRDLGFSNQTMLATGLRETLRWRLTA